MAPTWPSIMPLGATTAAPACAWATAMAAYRSRVASLSTSPAGVSRPQWPWSVYSSRHRSAMSTVWSPTSAARSPMASWTMPPGWAPAEPRPSLTAGMPNRMTPPTPASTASTAALRRLSRVCWTTPGMEPIGCGSVMPSLTNIGSTRSVGRSAVSATSCRSAAVRRSRRGLITGNPAFTGPPRSPNLLPDPLAGAPAALAGPAEGLAGLQRGPPLPGPELGQRFDQLRHGRPGRHHVDPEAELGPGLGRLRADHRDDRDRVRLTGDADQVPHGRGGGEQHRVETAALDRLADRRGRRGGPDRTVRGDVFGFPAQLGQAGDHGLRGGGGPGQQHPVDRVEHVVVRRPLLGQARPVLCTLGHQVRRDAEVLERGRRLVSDRGHLDPGERPGVQAVLLELLPDGPDRVDRGERDPLVAAGDQAADSPVHLLRRPGRLHRDRGHFLGHGALLAQLLGNARRVGLGPRHPPPPAEHR